MKKPNLLFIFADQWRRESIGFMGKEKVITPNIDNFAKNNTIFEKAYSTCPLCSPSRATILTGKYPITHNVITNCKPNLFNNFLSPNEITIGDILKNNNYSTGYIGKWHLDQPDLDFSKNPISKAKNWDAYTPPGPKRHGFDFWYSYGADDNHLSPHYWQDSHEQIKVNEWSVKHETDIALDFLNKNKENQFALFLSWNPPHTPLDLIPQKYVDLYDNIDIPIRDNVKLENIIDHPQTIEPFSLKETEYIQMVKKYYGAISGIDEYFGKIITYLKDNNLYDNTLIILTADHGEMLCSHGLWSKHVWYEESISVPFILSLGDQFKNINIKTPLSGVDIVPTILSLLSIKTDYSFHGIDLSPTLNGKILNNKAITMCYTGNPKIINNLKLQNKNPLEFGWRAVSDEEYTYVAFKNYNGNGKLKEFIYEAKDILQLNPLPVSEKNEYLKTYLQNWAVKYNDLIFN